MLIFTLSSSLTLVATGAAPTLPPYPEALACAAVAQAAAELSKDPVTGIPEGQVFDVAMYWSFVVMDAARPTGMSSKAAEAEQVTARAAVKPLLASGDAATKARLADCTARTPPLAG